MKLHLAPLEDITGPVFRRLCHEFGADYTYTEMARLDSLLKKNKSSWEKISLFPNTPTTVQILINKTKGLNTFLAEIQNNFPEIKSIDLNFGCSSPLILKCGLGAAMIKRVNRINEIIDTIRKHSNYTISIKMRLGMNATEKEHEVYIKTIKETTADKYTVHARHAKQKLDKKADWSVFEKCVATGKTIIANGDIKSKEDIITLNKIGVSEFMIGRAAMSNPEVFALMRDGNDKGSAFIKNKYMELLASCKERSKYFDNFLKYLKK